MSAEQSMSEVPVERSSPVSGGEQNNSSGEFETDENGDRSAQGLGQSKSSRRRRRKRKGKGPEAATVGGETSGAVEPMPGEVIGGVQAAGASAPQSQPRPQRTQFNGQNSAQLGQQNGQQQNSNAPGGTKRWKKKFRDRDRPRPGGDNPGNQVSAAGLGQTGNGQQQGGFRGPDTHQPGNGGGFKRKSSFGGGGKQQRQGGSRGAFVGPMDHSYRVVNGNVFDPGGESHSNGGGNGRGRYQGDSQPIDYSMGRAIPIAEGTPTRIYFFIDDLFFTAKIQETARKLGVKVAFVKNEKEQIAALTSGEEDTRPALIVFDLNNANAKPFTLIPKLRTKLKKSASIIGFLSHLQGDLKAKAVEAGCDTVMPRAAFSQNLPNLLRRYGIEDTDETNYNQ
jgi:CheY-like chemotaxis protein